MISFTAADGDRFLAEDNGEPVVMLNLLRFRSAGGRDNARRVSDKKVVRVAFGGSLVNN
jgi:hypothetical protein